MTCGTKDYLGFIYIHLALFLYTKRKRRFWSLHPRHTHTRGMALHLQECPLVFFFFSSSSSSLFPSTAAVVITLPNPSLPINAIKTNRLTRSDSIRPVFPSQPETYLGEASHLISNRKSLSLSFRITKQLEFSSTLSIGSRNLVGCRR